MRKLIVRVSGLIGVLAVLGACGSESSGGASTTSGATTGAGGAATSTTSGSAGDGAGGSPDAVSSSMMSTGAGGCDIDSDCDDADVCTDDGCSQGVCNHFEVDLDDDDECTVDACDPVAGVTNTLRQDIDDGDPCTADACDPVTGDISHEGDGCDDGDVCTTDTCEVGGGCVNAPGLCGPTYAGVQPIFQAKCTPCHEGASPESCAGSTCFVNHYEGTQLVLSGGPCDGLLAADCIIQTINDGSMPRGVSCSGDPVADAAIFGCVLAAEQAAIEQWIGSGSPP